MQIKKLFLLVVLFYSLNTYSLNNNAQKCVLGQRCDFDWSYEPRSPEDYSDTVEYEILPNDGGNFTCQVWLTKGTIDTSLTSRGDIQIETRVSLKGGEDVTFHLLGHYKYMNKQPRYIDLVNTPPDGDGFAHITIKGSIQCSRWSGVAT